MASPPTAPAALPLSRDRILACAVRLADRDGLEATSLRRVAAELGVHVTSLYHHVPTKDALLDGLVEQLFAGVDLPHGDVPWHSWVRGFAAATAALAEQHPGAFTVLLRRPVQGPGAVATFEVGLRAFRSAGADTATAYRALKSVSLAVLGCAAQQALAASGTGLATDISALSWREFPEVHRLPAEAADADTDAIRDLAEVLVAGLAARLQLPS